MSFLSRAKNLFIDFLFPKDEHLIELESLSPSEIYSTLPRAQENEKKNVLAIFDYSHPTVKEIVWQIKYSGNKIIAKTVAVVTSDVLKAELEELKLFDSAAWQNNKILLVPIPTSDRRRLERGWNQTELICQEIIALDQEKIFEYLPHKLVKIKHTESQTKASSKDERGRNIINTMRVSDDQSVKNRSIIVLDDVTTTGATFREAERALKLAGAKNIFCIAVAN